MENKEQVFLYIRDEIEKVADREEKQILEEADALEAISKKGYEIEFALIKESSIGTWDKYRGKFGY